MLWSFWTVAFPFMRRDVKHIQACSYWDWDDIDLLEMRRVQEVAPVFFCPALFFHFAGTQCLQNQLKEGHAHNMQWSNFYAWALWGLTLSIQLVQGRRDHGGIDRKLNSDRGAADYTLHTVNLELVVSPIGVQLQLLFDVSSKLPSFGRNELLIHLIFFEKCSHDPLCVPFRRDPFSLTDPYFWSESFGIVDTVCFYNPPKYWSLSTETCRFHAPMKSIGREVEGVILKRSLSEQRRLCGWEGLPSFFYWVLGSHGFGRLAELPKVLQADWTLISLRVQDLERHTFQGETARLLSRMKMIRKAVFVVTETSARRPGDKDSKWPGSQVRGHCEHSNCANPCCISCPAFTHVLGHVHT